MKLENTVASLNGCPDNSAARAMLADLERAGIFFPYDDKLEQHLGRLGMLKIGEMQFLVQREADIWQTIKIWQIKLIPLN